MTSRSYLRTTLGIMLLMTPLARVALAYEPDEVRAIVGTPRRPLAASVERVILASQRKLVIATSGAMTMEDHRLLLVGPNTSRRPFEERWTFQPARERVGLRIGRIHHPDGRVEEIPADSIRIAPHAAAGPAGYPGLSDCVVHAVVSPGDIAEIRAVCESKPIRDGRLVCGEYCFADADSVVESELDLAFSTNMAMLVWDFGGLPEATQSLAGANLVFRWLTGDLPALRPVTRLSSSAIGGVLPDSLSPPTILYGFQTDWPSVIDARSAGWARAMASSPPELASEAQHILDGTADPAERRIEAIRWLRDRFRDLQLPAARYRFHPLDPELVLAREDAVACDRAMILVWLLRHVGVSADAVTVRSRPGGDVDVPLPQQFDLWVVRSRIGSADPVWIDLRDETETDRPIPPGPGLNWTTTEGPDPIVSFPGISR